MGIVRWMLMNKVRTAQNMTNGHFYFTTYKTLPGRNSMAKSPCPCPPSQHL